jgi:hypothetical protein
MCFFYWFFNVQTGHFFKNIERIFSLILSFFHLIWAVGNVVTECFARYWCQQRCRSRWHTTSYSDERCILFYASTFSIFNRSLSTCVFPDRWKFSYVIPIFKKGRRNNVEDYRGVVILSAIPKRFELLVNRTMYTTTCSIWYLTWIYEKPIDGDELVGLRFYNTAKNLLRFKVEY